MIPCKNLKIDENSPCYFIFDISSPQNDPRPKQHYAEAHKDFKFILTWSPGVGGRGINSSYYYGLPFGFDGFQHCQEPRCYLTYEREQLGGKVVIS